MFNICSKNHTEIVYSGANCPCCLMLADLIDKDDRIDGLEKDNTELEKDNTSLRDELEEYTEKIKELKELKEKLEKRPRRHDGQA